MFRRALTHRRTLLSVAALTTASTVLYTTTQQRFTPTSPSLFNSNHHHQVYAEESSLDLNKVQNTVWTGNHSQCVIATIHIKNDKATRDRVLKKVNQLQDIVQRVQGEKTSVAEDEEEDEFTLPGIMAAVGFDTRLWKTIAQEHSVKLPPRYGEYKRRTGEYGTMPDTNGDLVLHVKAASRSQCFEVVQAFVDALGSDAVEVEDRYGWQFRDGRDLSGFLDGTMNPADREERIEAAIIPETHGSYLLHQVWSHDLKSLSQIGTVEQEGYVGRKKDWSAELAAHEMPLTSHVKRMRDVEGNRIAIVRQSMPYGSVGGDSGLLFIAYANSVEKFDDLLDRMVGKASRDGKHEGHNDAIMRFSKNIRGNYFYVPSKNELKKFA